MGPYPGGGLKTGGLKVGFYGIIYGIWNVSLPCGERALGQATESKISDALSATK